MTTGLPAALDAEQARRVATDEGVPHDGCLRLVHAEPALKRRVVLVDDRRHHPADVERLLAAGVGRLGEHVADRRELAAVRRAANITISNIGRGSRPRGKAP